MNSKTVLGLIILLIIFAGGYLLLNQNYGPPSSKTTESFPSPTSSLKKPLQEEENLSEASISVKDQQAENSIIISQALLPQPGYIVIHEDKDGKPGPVIGTSELLQDNIEQLEINLTRPANPGEVLYAMLHKDDGDGQYEFPGDDTPLKDNAGNVVVSKFAILSENTPQNQTQGATQTLQITSGFLFFNPNKITLKKGQPVKVVFKNTGVHTFTIDELGINISLRNPEETFEFTPNKSGTFEYYCAIPGHKEGGMIGELTVN